MRGRFAPAAAASRSRSSSSPPGACLFGDVSILQLDAQAGALFDVPSQVLSMLP